jgi:hypothetical protein
VLSRKPAVYITLAMHAGTLTGVLAAISSAAAFCWSHVGYWTQAGNCVSPCKPHLLTLSLVAGFLFFAVNIVLMQLELSPEPFSIRAKLIAKRAVIAFGGGLAACLLLIGLAVLPLVAVVTALAYGWLIASDIFGRRDG